MQLLKKLIPSIHHRKLTFQHTDVKQLQSVFIPRIRTTNLFSWKAAWFNFCCTIRVLGGLRKRDWRTIADRRRRIYCTEYGSKRWLHAVRAPVWSREAGFAQAISIYFPGRQSAERVICEFYSSRRAAVIGSTRPLTRIALSRRGAGRLQQCVGVFAGTINHCILSNA